MRQRDYYPTIVISDIHLGSEHSKITQVTNFLKNVDCDMLILNGDIIDGWQLQKTTRHWQQQHTDFFKVLMKMMEKQGTKIVYVRGNHDDFLDKITPFEFSNISIVKDFLYKYAGKSYYVTHGDIFDTITSNMRWLAVLGDIGYTFLLWLNKHYNRRRLRQGKPYYSLSQKVKHKVKSAVSYISDFEKELVKVAESKGVDGIICGHIHQPANIYYGNIHYLNSGDWVESMSALAQNPDGNWEVLEYSQEKYPENPSYETEMNISLHQIFKNQSIAL